MQSDQQAEPRRRAEGEHLRVAVQNDGEYQHVPAGHQEVRRARPGRVPDGGPVREEGHCPGHELDIRAGTSGELVYSSEWCLMEKRGVLQNKSTVHINRDGVSRFYILLQAVLYLLNDWT